MADPTRITIKQLARQAGVSVASVSRALNGQAGVGAQTRERISAMARQLGYAADSRARALVTGEVPFIGLVVPDITNPFYPEVARGAEQELLASGRSLLLVSTGWESGRLEQALDLLLSRHVAGLLVAVPPNGLLARAGLDWDALAPRVVVVGQEVPRGWKQRLCAMDVDDRHGGELVGQHLAGLGWSRLAIIAGPEPDRTAQARIAGFRWALEQTAQPAALTAVRHGEWSVRSGHRLALELLHGRPSPDAIFAANDLIALGAAQAARETGRNLGQDLGLVGYDDIEPMRYLQVPITSVAQPKLELGRRAARLLLEALARGGVSRPAPLKPKLVVRDSCGAAARTGQAEQTTNGGVS